MILSHGALFFLQMAVVLALCRVFGLAARRLGQPQVVGEMVAGVFLGPSLLGRWFPGAIAWLFPPASLQVLDVCAQLGVGLYMFLVGLELRIDLFRRSLGTALSVSLAGMVVPFALGCALVPWLEGLPGMFGGNTGRLEAMLFLGAALSITAFPMLARIIEERGLRDTPLGTLVLAAGSIDDAAAWCVFAVVLSISGQGTGTALGAILGGLAYVVLALTLVPILFRGLAATAPPAGRLSGEALASVLLAFCLGAGAMEAAGLHAVFGGFVLGAAMPRGKLAAELERQLGPLVAVFLVPIFFAHSGLKTRLDLLIEPALLGVSALVLAVACLGKLGACYAAARLRGEERPVALAVGALMNARGMMELILLNLGLELNIIGPQLFSMMVLMALVTTLMATPLYELVHGRNARRPAPPAGESPSAGPRQ